MTVYFKREFINIWMFVWMSLLCYKCVKYLVLFIFYDVGAKESDPSPMSAGGDDVEWLKKCGILPTVGNGV